MRKPTIKQSLIATAAVLLALASSACVYRIDIQQGNWLEEESIDQVQIGMTRSQVQFLLGTPMVADAFHANRWDYAYYYRRGRSRDIFQRWFVVHFGDDNRVVRLDRDLTLNPAS